MSGAAAEAPSAAPPQSGSVRALASSMLAGALVPPPPPGGGGGGGGGAMPVAVTTTLSTNQPWNAFRTLSPLLKVKRTWKLVVSSEAGTGNECVCHVSMAAHGLVAVVPLSAVLNGGVLTKPFVSIWTLRA